MFRVRHLLPLGFAAAIVIAAGAQQPVFHADADTVSIYATVVDGSGRLVVDLTRGDFDVFDNGRRRDLTVFANDVQPITIVVMLDRSGSVAKNFELVQRATEVFIRQLLPADRARLGSFSSRIQIDPAGFTSDRAELVRILHENLQPAGPTPLWEAANAALSALAAEPGRRVVLVFTDGKDTPGWLGTPGTSFEDVRRRAQVDDVMVYGVGLSNPCEPDEKALLLPATPRLQRRGPRWPVPGGRLPRPPGPRPIPLPPPSIPGREFPPRTPPFGLPRDKPGGCVDEAPDPELRLLAADGGGGYFELGSGADLPDTFARVAEELHHQYVLAFTPTELDGTLHELDVRVRRPGMTVRARRSYFAPRDPAGP
jgi:VWFA-related protein